MKAWAVGVALVVLNVIAVPVAQAHKLACDKLVNGVPVYTITSYPATLAYTLTVRNVHPTSSSKALVATDPFLNAQFGQDFTPVPPFTLPLNGSVTDVINVTINSFNDCIRLAALDGRVDTFIDNVFFVEWDSGEAQCRARVVCLRQSSCTP